MNTVAMPETREPIQPGDPVNDGHVRGVVLRVNAYQEPYQPRREDVYVLWLPDLPDEDRP